MREGIEVAEAQEIVLEAATPLGPETVTTREALGRVLTEPVASARSIPPADDSAMDGYAVRAADTASATREAPASLAVAFTLAAGAEAGAALGPGQAARILTGAPVPPGADAVVMQEHVERDGDVLRVFAPVPERDHIRPAGGDVRAGEVVLEAGTRLGPAHLGMLAALGRSVVSVVQRPRVAIVSSGDELVEPDGDIRGGRIVSSNSYSIAALCREVGAEPHYLGIAPDDPGAVENRLRAGLRADVLVSSAGVSVGDRDHVRGALEKLGCRLVFWGVRMKPGYPMVFGRFEHGDGPLVFGLPGNPVSAMVTFEQFVRPVLRRMAGHGAWFRRTLRVRLAEPLRKKAGRLHFVRVRFERDGDEMVVRTTGSQSSGVLRSMTLAHGLLIFPAEATELAAGAEVNVQVLDEDALLAGAAGL